MWGLMSPAYLILGVIGFFVACFGLIAFVDLVTQFGRAIGF